MRKEKIHVMDGVKATVLPKYNPFQTGHGAYASKKTLHKKNNKLELQKLNRKYCGY